jgi:hypothetical protein
MTWPGSVAGRLCVPLCWRNKPNKYVTGKSKAAAQKQNATGHPKTEPSCASKYASKVAATPARKTWAAARAAFSNPGVTNRVILAAHGCNIHTESS